MRYYYSISRVGFASVLRGISVGPPLLVAYVFRDVIAAEFKVTQIGAYQGEGIASRSQ
jgi:hypothetical protein